MAGAHTAHLAIDRSRALAVALGANAAFMVVEAAAGIAFSSLALLADAAHMLSDVAALTIALVSQRLIDRPGTARHTYGLQRAEVLGALANGVLLSAISVWIAVEAIGRIGDPLEVEGLGLTVVATLGLLVNLGSAALIGRARGGSLNMHGAYVHLLADAAGSVAAAGAGIAVLVWSAHWADPVISLAISAVVVVGAWRLVREAGHVLLEAAPRGMDVGEVEGALAAAPGVEAVHHLHIWNLASDVPALSAHVVLEGELTLHEAQERGAELKSLLAKRFGIDHATLDLECHTCE